MAAAIRFICANSRIIEQKHSKQHRGDARMRTQGMLVKWNADRGFGFIKTRDSGIEIFVHVSAFPRSGRLPQIGDPLAFDIAPAADGRKQAQAVTFDVPLGRADFTLSPVDRKPASNTHGSASAQTSTPHRAHRRHEPARESSGLLFKLLAGALLIGAIVFGHRKFTELRGNSAAPSVTPASPAAAAPTPAYRCDGREHCSQMSSCAEATWFILHCPNTKMDGDNDGTPCEQQLCG
jgi:cold shock CspA family protein